MGLDPALPFPRDPMAALYARVVDAERRLRAPSSPAAATYAIQSAAVQTTSINYVDLGGPTVTLKVPDAGAFVEIYAEAEGRDVNATGIPVRAGIYEATDLPINGPDDGTYMEWNVGAAFEVRRLQPGRLLAGGQNALGLGGRCIYWATGGTRSYQLRYCDVAGNLAEFRNRRIWARVAP